MDWSGSRARARDGLGNQGAYPASAQVQVTIDRTPPGVQVTNITESSAYAHANGVSVYYGVGSGNYTVQVHATDNLAGLDTPTFPSTTSGGASFDYNGETSVYRSRV